MKIPRLSKSALWGIGSFLLCMGVFSGHLYSGDGEAYFSVAWNLLMGNPPVIPHYLEGFGVHGIGGYYYSKFGIGLSILIMPFLVVGLFIGILTPGVMLTGGQLRAIALLQGPILAGFLIVVIYGVLERMDVSSQARDVSLVSLILGGLWVSYSRTLFSEVAVAVCLLLLWHQTYEQSRQSDWIMAITGAFSVLLRIETVVIVGPVLLVRLLHRGRWLPLILPPVLSGCLIGYYNYFRFGDVLMSGMGESKVEAFSTPLMVGLIGQFFAPGNGLFVYSPFLFIAVLVCLIDLPGSDCWPGFYFWALCIGSLIYLVIHSLWHSWMGGWSWGPRRMIPLLPFFHLLVGLVWDRFTEGLKIFFLLICLLTPAINLGGILSDFNLYYRGRFYDQDVLYNFYNSQVFAHNRLLLAGEIPVDVMWVRMFPTWGWLLVSILTMLGISLIGWAGLRDRIEF